MNLSKKQFDILVCLEDKGSALSQRDLSGETGISLGTVNKLLAELSEQGLVADGTITQAGLEALEPYRVKRAVFMAAGFGHLLNGTYEGAYQNEKKAAFLQNLGG